jgi:hypothetical protein
MSQFSLFLFPFPAFFFLVLLIGLMSIHMIASPLMPKRYLIPRLWPL